MFKEMESRFFIGAERLSRRQLHESSKAVVSISAVLWNHVCIENFDTWVSYPKIFMLI